MRFNMNRGLGPSHRPGGKRNNGEGSSKKINPNSNGGRPNVRADAPPDPSARCKCFVFNRWCPKHGHVANISGLVCLACQGGSSGKGKEREQGGGCSRELQEAQRNYQRAMENNSCFGSCIAKGERAPVLDPNHPSGFADRGQKKVHKQPKLNTDMVKFYIEGGTSKQWYERLNANNPEFKHSCNTMCPINDLAIEVLANTPPTKIVPCQESGVHVYRKKVWIRKSDNAMFSAPSFCLNPYAAMDIEPEWFGWQEEFVGGSPRHAHVCRTCGRAASEFRAEREAQEQRNQAEIDADEEDYQANIARYVAIQGKKLKGFWELEQFAALEEVTLVEAAMQLRKAGYDISEHMDEVDRRAAAGADPEPQSSEIAPGASFASVRAYEIHLESLVQSLTTCSRRGQKVDSDRHDGSPISRNELLWLDVQIAFAGSYRPLGFTEDDFKDVARQPTGEEFLSQTVVVDDYDVLEVVVPGDSVCPVPLGDAVGKVEALNHRSFYDGVKGTLKNQVYESWTDMFVDNDFEDIYEPVYPDLAASTASADPAPQCTEIADDEESVWDESCKCGAKCYEDCSCECEVCGFSDCQCDTESEVEAPWPQRHEISSSDEARRELVENKFRSRRCLCLHSDIPCSKVASGECEAAEYQLREWKDALFVQWALKQPQVPFVPRKAGGSPHRRAYKKFVLRVWKWLPKRNDDSGVRNCTSFVDRSRFEAEVIADLVSVQDEADPGAPKPEVDAADVKRKMRNAKARARSRKNQKIPGTSAHKALKLRLLRKAYPFARGVRKKKLFEDRSMSMLKWDVRRGQRAGLPYVKTEKQVAFRKWRKFKAVRKHVQVERKKTKRREKIHEVDGPSLRHADFVIAMEDLSIVLNGEKLDFDDWRNLVARDKEEVRLTRGYQDRGPYYCLAWEDHCTLVVKAKSSRLTRKRSWVSAMDVIAADSVRTRCSVFATLGKLRPASPVAVLVKLEELTESQKNFFSRPEGEGKDVIDLPPVFYTDPKRYEESLTAPAAVVEPEPVFNYVPETGVGGSADCWKKMIGGGEYIQDGKPISLAGIKMTLEYGLMTASLFPCSMVGPDDCWGCMRHRHWEDAWTAWFDEQTAEVQEDPEAAALLFSESWHVLIVPQGEMLHIEEVKSYKFDDALSFAQVNTMSAEEIIEHVLECHKKKIVADHAANGDFSSMISASKKLGFLKKKMLSFSDVLLGSATGTNADALIQKSMEINGPQIALQEATVLFNNEAKSMPSVPFVMTDSEKMKFKDYVGRAVRCLGRKCSWNDHLFLEAARHLIREELTHLFPHNTDIQSVLHVGATATQVSTWIKHAGHDFQFAMKDDKDQVRTIEEMSKRLATKCQEYAPPVLRTMRKSNVKITFDSLNEVARALTIGGRDRFGVGSAPPSADSVLPTPFVGRRYNVLMFEDSLYDITQEDFARYWEDTDAKVGYATMFFPHAMIDPNVEPSPHFEYSEYFDPYVTARWLADTCWPSILAFSWALPIKGMARLLHQAICTLSAAGWGAFKDWVMAVKQDEFPIQLLTFSILDVYKFLPIISQVMNNLRPVFRKYAMRAKVYWRGGVSNGYDHPVRTWEAWLKEPRVKAKGFFIDSEIVTRIGEMYLIRFWKSSGASPIVRSLQLPIELDYVRVADLENAWDSIHKVFKPFTYKSFRASVWFEMLNWCLAQPLGSLDFAVVQNAINRTSKGLSVGANILAAAAPHDKSDNSSLALALLMETFKRRNVVKSIEEDEALRSGYQTRLSEIVQKVAKLGFAVFTGGLGVAAWYFYRYIMEQVQVYEFVKYSEPPDEIHVKAQPGASARESSGQLSFVLPPAQEGGSHSCLLCDLQAKGAFSINGDPAEGQKFHLSKHDVDNIHDISMDEGEVLHLVSKVRDTRMWHQSKGATVTAKIHKFEDWLSGQRTGLSKKVKIEHVRGGPGTGKSEIIKSLCHRLEKAGISVAVTMPFSELQSEYTNCQVLGVNGRHNFKADTIWYTLQHSNINTLIVDETTGVDWNVLRGICTYIGVETIYLVGDRGQTHLRAEAGEGIDPTATLSGLDWTKVPEHELVYNYRMGAWRTKMLNKMYGYRMISKRTDDDRPIFQSRERYVAMKEQGQPINREMVFTHLSAPPCFGAESSSDRDSGVANMSVRSSQGLTVDYAAVGLSDLDISSLDVTGFVCVAVSRSKRAPYIVYPSEEENEAAQKLKKLISMDTEENANAIFDMAWPDVPKVKVEARVKPEHRAFNDYLSDMVQAGKVKVEEGSNDEFSFQAPAYKGKLVNIDSPSLSLSQPTVKQLVDLYKSEFHWCFFDALESSGLVAKRKLENFALRMAEECYYNDGMMGRPIRDKSARIRGANLQPLPQIAIKDTLVGWITKRLMPLDYLISQAHKRLGVSIVLINDGFMDEPLFETRDVKDNNSINTRIILMSRTKLRPTMENADFESSRLGHVVSLIDKQVAVKTPGGIIKQPAHMIVQGYWVGHFKKEGSAYVLEDRGPSQISPTATQIASMLEANASTVVRNREQAVLQADHGRPRTTMQELVRAMRRLTIGDDPVSDATSSFDWSQTRSVETNEACPPPTETTGEIDTFASVQEQSDPLLREPTLSAVLALPNSLGVTLADVHQAIANDTSTTANWNDPTPNPVRAPKLTNYFSSLINPKGKATTSAPVTTIEPTTSQSTLKDEIPQLSEALSAELTRLAGGLVDNSDGQVAVDQSVVSAFAELAEHVQRDLKEDGFCKGCKLVAGEVLKRTSLWAIAIGSAIKLALTKSLKTTKELFGAMMRGFRLALFFAKVKAGNLALQLASLPDQLKTWVKEEIEALTLSEGNQSCTCDSNEPLPVRDPADFPPDEDPPEMLSLAEQLEANATLIEEMRTRAINASGATIGLYLEDNNPSGVPFETKTGKKMVKHVFKEEVKYATGALYDQRPNTLPGKIPKTGTVVVVGAPYIGKTNVAKDNPFVLDLDNIVANSGLEILVPRDPNKDWGPYNDAVLNFLKSKLQTLPREKRHVLLTADPFWAQALGLPVHGCYRSPTLRHVPMAERSPERDELWKVTQKANWHRCSPDEFQAVVASLFGKKTDFVRREFDDLNRSEFVPFVDPGLPVAHKVRAAEIVDSIGVYCSRDDKSAPDIFDSGLHLRAVGQDTYKLHDYLAPRSLEDDPVLNHHGPEQGMMRLNNAEVNWGNTFHQITKSGEARPYQDKYVKSLGHGLANYFGDSVQETLLASERIGQLCSKPRLDAEKSEWTKAVAAKVVKDCWKATTLSIEEHNRAVCDAWADARKRSYGPRADAEYRDSFGEPTLVCNNKTQQKPIKNDKLDVLKTGQLIVQSPPDVNLKFIAMQRIYGRTLKKSAQEWFFMDDYENPDVFNARLTTALNELPDCALYGIMDFKEFDSQQNEVTVAIEKEVARLMGVPNEWVEEYYQYRQKGIAVAFPGLFKIRLNQEKPSGFLDTKSGNTILSCSLATWLFDYQGPRVHAAKGDDTFFCATGLAVNKLHAAQVDKFTGMKYSLDISSDGGEFIGCTVGKGGIFKSITRTAMKAICKPAKDFEQFKEHQKALRDAIESWRVGGLDETIHCSAAAEGKSADFVQFCYDFVVSWSSVSREQWESIVKERRVPRYNFRTADGPDLIA